VDFWRTCFLRETDAVIVSSRKNTSHVFDVFFVEIRVRFRDCLLNITNIYIYIWFYIYIYTNTLTSTSTKTFACTYTQYGPPQAVMFVGLINPMNKKSLYHVISTNLPSLSQVIRVPTRTSGGLSDTSWRIQRIQTSHRGPRCEPRCWYIKSLQNWVSLDFWANVGFDNPASWSINRGEFSW